MTARKVLAGVIVVVAIAAGGAAVAAGAVGRAGATPTQPAAGSSHQRTAVVTRKTLQVEAALSGTLGYAGSIGISAGLAGTVTWVPNAGTVIGRGGALYEVDGSRKAILLIGATPAWRTMAFGVPNGRDVAQLEANLKALGFTSKAIAIDGHWDRATTDAVKRWQKATGLAVDGIVDLGEVAFLPDAIRVTTAAALGSMAGGEVLHGTTDRRVVSVSLEATRRDLLALDRPVTIALPDGSTKPGRVTEVGRVAHSAENGSGPGSGGTPTIDVTIALDDASAAAELDQAPVTVRVVTETRQNVLAVPVNALVALLEGGYAVEIVAADGSTRYAGVRLGMFDAGWVEITSGDVHEGDSVVVPS